MKILLTLLVLIWPVTVVHGGEAVVTNLEKVRDCLRQTLQVHAAEIRRDFASALERNICDGPIVARVDESGLTVQVGQWDLIEDQRKVIARYEEVPAGKTATHTKVIEVVVQFSESEIRVIGFKLYSTF